MAGTTQEAEQQALAAGANPSTLVYAKQNLGSSDYKGYCEKFVSDAMQSSGENVQRYGSATEAWNNRPQQTDTSQISPGDVVYFVAGPNTTDEAVKKWGHTGVYSGDGKFISATNAGVKEWDLGVWERLTGQKLLGYVDKTPGSSGGGKVLGTNTYAGDTTTTINQSGQTVKPISGTPGKAGIPSNYTGLVGNTLYVNGKVETGGGGITPDGSYSAGYHGSGNNNIGGKSVTSTVIGERDGKPVLSNSSSVPSGFTGWQGNQPYVGGTPQTSGGGFTPDGSYSAGYHGGGGGPQIDMGPFGNGPNMGPTVNGTVQTGGGGFTPDGSYSAGYHGSGEHPEITGESLPGDYRSGSFGSLHHPDFSNGAKVSDWVRYVQKLGYNVDKLDKQAMERSYYDNGGNFDGLAMLAKLSTDAALAKKTELLAQATANPMMPTAQALALLGGSNFTNLAAGLAATPGSAGGGNFSWTPAGAFGSGPGYGNNPTGPYAGWTGGNVPIPSYPYGSITPFQAGATVEKTESSTTKTPSATGTSSLTGQPTTPLTAVNALTGANTSYSNLFNPPLLGISTIA